MKFLTYGGGCLVLGSRCPDVPSPLQTQLLQHRTLAKLTSLKGFTGRRHTDVHRYRFVTAQAQDDREYHGPQQGTVPGSVFSQKDRQELSRLMPDPQMDELFDNNEFFDDTVAPNYEDLYEEYGLHFSTLQSHPGSQLIGRDSFGGPNRWGNDSWGDDGLGSHPATPVPLEDLDRDTAQARWDYTARRRWELEQVQNKAMEVHHRQNERAANRYTMAVKLGEIMEQIEMHDHFQGWDDPVPSWIRAMLILEQDFEETNAESLEQQELSSLAVDQQRQDEEGEMDSLPTEGGFAARIDDFWSQPADPTVDPLDQFLNVLPGASIGRADQYLGDILGAPSQQPQPRAQEQPSRQADVIDVDSDSDDDLDL